MSVKKIVITSYIGEDEHAGFEFAFRPVEDTITIKKTETGYTARYLVWDDDAASPEDDRDDNLFLVGYHRDFTIEHNIPRELAGRIANGGKYEDGSIHSEAKGYLKKYHVFGLEAYIHSGVRLALAHEGNFPDRCWDVSQLGLVFVAKSEWRTRTAARAAALGLIETWNCYLSGDVYGIVTETYDQNKKWLDGDSYWGYYGYKYALEELKQEAAG